MHPLGEVSLGTGLHAEETAAHINHLPGEEEGKPSQADKGRRTCSEYGATFFFELVVAMGAEVSISEAEHHQRESCQT